MCLQGITGNSCQFAFASCAALHSVFLREMFLHQLIALNEISSHLLHVQINFQILSKCCDKLGNAVKLPRSLSLSLSLRLPPSLFAVLAALALCVAWKLSRGKNALHEFMLEQFLPQLIKTRGWLHATHATYHIQLSRCQVAGRWDKRGQWLLAARQALSINDYSQGDSPSHKSRLMTIEQHHTHTSILISTQTVRVPWNLPIFQRVPTHTHTHTYKRN